MLWPTKSHSPFGKQIVSMFQNLSKFFDPEILSLEISPKGSFGSLEISFMHGDIYGDIFYDSEKLKQKI